ncbi:MAG: type I secretion system permease/ATPase [Methylococcales bacterium]|nr:type I secretion system permease/ATPase [Methylococcales bacterium]
MEKLISQDNVITEVSEWEKFCHSDDSQDPLLSCLVYLCQHYDRPLSKDVLIAGLPVYEGNISPELLLRSAERAGFKSRVMKKKLSEVSDILLPSIAILNGQKACVLLSQDQGNYEVMMPEQGGGVITLSKSQLSEMFQNYCIVIRPERHEGDQSNYNQHLMKQKHWFWQVLHRDWWIFVQVAMAAVLINIFALTVPLFIMTVYDRVIPNDSQETLWVLAFGAIAVFVFDFIVKGLRGYFVDVSGRRVDVLLARKIFNQVLNLSMKAKPESSGSFANTLKELESLRDFFTSATLLSIVDFPFVFFFITIFWLIGGQLAWVLVIMVPIIFAITTLFQFPLRHAVKDAYRFGEMKHSVLIETLIGLETIKSVGADAKVRQKWEESVAQNATAGQQSRLWSLSSINLTLFAQQLTTVLIVIVGVYLVHEGELSFGMLIACVMLSGRTMAPLAQVAQMLVKLHHTMAAFKSLDNIMNLAIERPVDKKFIHRASFAGQIGFKKVIFKYPEQALNAIEDVSFTISAGEKVGVIGRIGSGKTTLQKLILSLYEPEEGAVLIDGIDLRQIDPVDLRKAIGYVPQDLFLFQGTIKENIVAGHPRASDAEILVAAKLSGLDDFVSVHPLGYDMPVGERGESLSGGQRQTVVLARSLIHNPSILLFDEPTNAMDSRSEEQFKKRMELVLADKTMVLVTHRASLLSMVDRILVMDQGRLLADGPRDAVLEAIASGKITINEG